jgi:hypothetical protein
MKVCNKCNVEKPLNEYYKGKTKKFGVQDKCKQCNKRLAIEWYNGNKERHTTNTMKWQHNNQDKQDNYVRKNYSKISSGVYQIKCMINGKRYIGKSIRPNRRMYEHFTISDSHQSNEALQADIKQYGKQSFVFGIIEHCPTELLLERETYYINTYKPEYNAQVGAFKTTK